jgi:hypothetical protein
MHLFESQSAHANEVDGFHAARGAVSDVVEKLGGVVSDLFNES